MAGDSLADRREGAVPDLGRTLNDAGAKGERVRVGDGLDRGGEREPAGEQRLDSDQGTRAAVANGHRPPIPRSHVHPDQPGDDDLEMG